ncbi:centrosomal protein of 290 kDa [Neodiprion fabricii]|uniref:centrosomal protein of 290 kDa n=1 Tax=Neodiprion fabricii TaxID=2872261 RepID=UPI001ED935B0|nr:centrosomal protein of 290 kDa [Neodiprion fabricii]
MVRINWERVLSVKPAALTDEEIEDLFPMVVSCDIDNVENINNLKALMKLSQEMLQHKDNQVESLLLECDELKGKISAMSSKTGSASKRKKSLASDLVNDDEDSAVSSGSSLARDRNQKIATLMSELETIETENITLKEKLRLIKEEMEDSTVQMNQMTEKLSSLKGQNTLYKEKLAERDRENKALLSQIKAITAQQLDRDNVIDEFSTAIDARVTEWKLILDEKDAEITALRENLSQSMIHSLTSIRDENKSQVVHLNEIIKQRDQAIEELQNKLSEAVTEMNESTILIEKLKADAQRFEKSSRRKEQRNLLKKIQEANEKIINLQNVLAQTESDAEIKSKELCEALIMLKRYENSEYGLAEATNELRNLKSQLQQKEDHIEDLIHIINKMEELSSQQEMKIVALCEKLELPPDETIPVDGIVSKHTEELRKAENIKLENEFLKKENIELKSDVRALKYRLKALAEKTIVPHVDTVETQSDLVVTTPMKMSKGNYNWLVEREAIAQRHMNEIEEIKNNVRIVVEENEALRKGMHEILDSVHKQDGSCAVEIQSETLEQLLEALDVRHLAGWYHPAMRLQSRLNTIEGSNSELRAQLRQIRSELQKKDEILRQIVLNDSLKKTTSDSVSETGEVKPRHSLGPIDAQDSCENEKSEWQIERTALYEEKNELEDTIMRLEVHLEEYEKNWQVLESGEEEIKKAFVKMCKESAEHAVQTIVINRKCKILEELLSRESTKYYNRQKEYIASENELRKRLANLEKSNKILDARISTLQSNLSNSVSSVEFNELKEKHNEACIRLRMVLEERGVYAEEDSALHNEAKSQLGESEDPVRISEGEYTGNESDVKLEKQPDHGPQTSHVTKLHENAQNQLTKYKAEVAQFSKLNFELQEEIVGLHKQLSKYVQGVRQPDETKICELEEKVTSLKIQNENAERRAKIADQEAQMHAAQNFLKTFEMDSMRHQLLDLQSVSEDKEIIARLGFELTNCKILEAETSKRNILLQNEISHLQDVNVKLKQKTEDSLANVRDCQKQCDARCRSYLDVIEFLQRQYAGSTSLTALERFESILKKSKVDRLAIDELLKEATKNADNIRTQQDVLAGRLQVVEQLKNILEEQIGNPDVQDIIHRFSESSQSKLGELRYKRQINQLENELQIVNSRIASQDTLINAMESEMIFIQKIWSRSSNNDDGTSNQNPEINIIDVDVDVVDVETASIAVQTHIESRSVETQVHRDQEAVPITSVRNESNEDGQTDYTSQIGLNERLNQALSLASERSALLVKYELEIAEYRDKIATLNEQLAEKNSLLSTVTEKTEEPVKFNPSVADIETSDKIVLRSTVNSLQKIITQKEETILRYQNLLKEDRDEHSKAAARLQEEIKSLQARVAGMQQQVNQKINDYIHLPEALPVREKVHKDRNKNIDLEEEAEKLNERVSTLEADLSIAKELGERWHRLAEERLKHMDHMRGRLDEQHKNELESYRMERDKWQLEADTLRQQLSDNRVQLAKGNSLLSKELQERDNRIHELDIAYQELQNEMELAERNTVSRQTVAHDSKMQEITNSIGRAQSNQLQSQLDLARKQLQALAEKEKNYKSQIVDLKQQLSRRYMAAKTHEQRNSQREIQLERKARGLEEELHTLKLQLEREKFTHENKKLKTAEELALWDKQKRWQQTAEKFKEKLKDKTEEYNKLQANHEKLRAVVSCMEREKWYLRSKLRCENGCLIGSLSARPRTLNHTDILEDLQHECHTLRSRVRELTDRLESADTSQLILQIEAQRRQISSLETVTKGNEYVVDQLERLEATKDVLEKNNLKLESENLELRLEIERIVLDTPRLREKVEHLEKYVELLKVEKSTESSPRLFAKESHEHGNKSTVELEKTVFTLKRVIEKLQAENKRLKVIAKKNPHPQSMTRPNSGGSTSSLHGQYERAQQRVVALETDLQLAEQRIAMLENSRKEEDNAGEIGVLRQQLAHKSELLDKVKQLLTRAAINEKSLRQKIQMLEAKQSLETIPECYVSPPTPDD